jgi:DNA-directed RNA polymerase subunit RPC12/RpoP
MSEQRCSNCGAELPAELGQHALTPTSGLVQCPTCGENVTLERPADAGEAGGEHEESFSGHETIEGVMDEIREKEET